MPKRDNRARAATGARGRCGATRGGASGAAHMGEHRNQPPPNATCHRPSEVTAGWLHTSTTGHNWRSQCNPAPNRSWAQRNFYRSGLSRGGVVAAVATVAGSLTKVPKAVAVEVKAQGKPGTGGMPGLHRTASAPTATHRAVRISAPETRQAVFSHQGYWRGPTRCAMAVYPDDAGPPPPPLQYAFTASHNAAHAPVGVPSRGSLCPGGWSKDFAAT